MASTIEQMQHCTINMESQNDKITVCLPDMFKTFLQEEPLVNPHYQTVRPISEQWLNRICSFAPKMQMKINKCNFSYFCAITAPHAAKDEFQTVCDWGNWVFPFDDLFDDGELRDSPKVAVEIMDMLRMGMEGQVNDGEKLPIVHAHDDVFGRIAANSSQGVTRRFATAMNNYCRGALVQVEDFSTGSLPRIEEMLITRRSSIGVMPLYALVEYAHRLRIPDTIFEHPVIKDLEDLGADMISITNDIISYRKEENEGVPHNMVAVCRMHGMTAQQAFDTVGALLDARYTAWDAAIARLPSWGSEIDIEVSKYVEGIKNTVKANLNWSFQSERYVGINPARVRRTRQIEVLANPSFLSGRPTDKADLEIVTISEIGKKPQTKLAAWSKKTSYLLVVVVLSMYSKILYSSGINMISAS